MRQLPPGVIAVATITGHELADATDSLNRPVAHLRFLVGSNRTPSAWIQLTPEQARDIGTALLAWTAGTEEAAPPPS